MPRFSFIIPVYNRPQEVQELLASFKQVEHSDFEIIVVEDGSNNDCIASIEQYKNVLPLCYYSKENSGPGSTRNFGADHAKGEWLIFLDSDTLIPSDYLKNIENKLEKGIGAFGGADRDMKNFLPIQKAISYSMTSFLTTGGIRGNRHSLEKFKPRSFNMGVLRELFEQLGGFGAMRYGEDIDFSLRIEDAGYATQYIEGGFVYHKRRTSLKAFFNQVMHSGEARVLLSKLHKSSFKFVHLLPTIFTLGLLITLILISISPTWAIVGLASYSAYSFILFIDAFIKKGSLTLAFYCVLTSFVQLIGYGYGFLRAKCFS